MTDNTIISAPAGFFAGDTVGPDTATDLLSAVQAAQANLDGAIEAEANAVAAAAAAATSATAAAGSANSASTSATSAATSASNASASVTTATAQATAAGVSASAASASATDAANSATTAGTSATNAASSASAASSSATAASTSATNASASATAAANSATSAASSATNAAASFTGATGQAANAGTSATNAAASATAASGSASAASTSATSASGSASSASTSASNASSSATTASTAATNASASATAAATSATNAATSASQASVAVGSNVGRNFIHNPVFSIAQRGAGPFNLPGAFYTLDRWSQDFLFDSMSVTQAALADADRTAIGDESARFTLQSVFTGTSAQPNARTRMYQRIEDVYRLGGKTVTVSFWAKASSGAPKVGISIDQNFGTGGSPSTAVTGTGSAVTISTSWARYQHTFTVPSTSGKTVGTNGDHNTQVNLWLSAGGSSFTTAGGGIGAQSNTIQLWGVQVEPGTSATALEAREPPDEIQRCQRFFQYHTAMCVFALATAASQTYLDDFLLPTSMRAAPSSVVFDTVANTNASGLAVNNAAATNVRILAISSAAGASEVIFNAAISADL